MAQACATESSTQGELEADESFFGPKCGRGAGGKTFVIGLPKRGNCMYTEIIPDASKATLQVNSRGKIDPNSVTHTDGWSG